MRLRFEIVTFIFFWEIVFSERLESLGTLKNSNGRCAADLKLGDSLFNTAKDGSSDRKTSTIPKGDKELTHDSSSGYILGQDSGQMNLKENSFFTTSKGRNPLSNKSNLENNSSFDFPNKENETATSSGPNATEKNYETTVEESVQESAEVEEKDICFPVVGCFSMKKPWKSVFRPIGIPSGPEVLQTTLHFYSRENPKNQKNITLYPKIDMSEAKFDPGKITAIIVHGFLTHGNATWMKNMKDAYLKHVDANVIIVDWSKGAQKLNYFQVCGNARVVGKQLALFVEYLKKNYGANTKRFHLIGHSLGAQVSSYLAKDVPGIARLTALDPAQPAFEGFQATVRLDKSDADFVDVIHTDAKPIWPTFGFGMMAPHGHVDFYINGGFDQPGCLPLPQKDIPDIKSPLDLLKFPVELIAKIISCSHSRAYEILTESFNEINNCIFWGHKATVVNVLRSMSNTISQGIFTKILTPSKTCTVENCIPLGFATRKSPLRGSFVITTNGRKPFCISEPGIFP